MTAINIATFTDRISECQLEQLCSDNPEARFEITSQGKLIVMPPTGSLTGEKNSDLLIQIGIWNRQHKLGKIFDSSTGFRLSNGAIRSPDVSWIEISRWQAVPKEQQRRFAPIDPDLAIELMSPTDELNELQQKMEEYLNCGVKLGWLIAPDLKQVEVYRQGQSVELLDNPFNLSGEDILPGLVVDLTDVFSD